jgi:hypothetical protein
MIEAFLEFCPCFLEGLELLLGGRNVIRYQIDVNRRCRAHEEFVRSSFEGIVFSQVVCIFCYWQELCPASRV